VDEPAEQVGAHPPDAQPLSLGSAWLLPACQAR
jgi:hypothetical protein